ncbi:MAG: hypothetical protein M3Q69_06005 [Acidobacteriota bacterium]|nr:hypothetical protein [Acidobacteriota bacterium]
MIVVDRDAAGALDRVLRNDALTHICLAETNAAAAPEYPLRRVDLDARSVRQ